MDLGEIKLKEVSLIIDLLRAGSVRELSRQQNIRPGQISKWIHSLELKLGHRLLDRSNQGVALTPEGQELLPFFKDMALMSHRLNDLSQEQIPYKEYTFATTSFFSTHLLPEVFNNIRKSYSELRFRLVDLPPDQLIAVAMRGGFDFCVHVSDLDWPKTWTSEKVGHIEWNLYARKKHPVLGKPQLKNVLQYPFVYPIYWTSEGLNYGNDNCPVPIKKRILGDQTATATSAVEVVRNTNQLGFLPELVARPYTRTGELVKIDIRSWKKVTAPVFLTVKSDAITQKTYRDIQSFIGKLL